MTDETVTELTDALVILARLNIPPDIQELLVYGNPDRGIAPGALAAVLRHRTAAQPGGDLEARAREWLAWMGWTNSPVNAPEALARELRAVQLEALERAAKVADEIEQKQENDLGAANTGGAAEAAAAIRARP